MAAGQAGLAGRKEQLFKMPLVHEGMDWTASYSFQWPAMAIESGFSLLKTERTACKVDHTGIEAKADSFDSS